MQKEPIKSRRIKVKKVPCPRCHGSGAIICPDCEGKRIELKTVK